jgi:hypothetical protein
MRPSGEEIAPGGVFLATPREYASAVARKQLGTRLALVEEARPVEPSSDSSTPKLESREDLHPTVIQREKEGPAAEEDPVIVSTSAEKPVRRKRRKGGKE